MKEPPASPSARLLGREIVSRDAQTGEIFVRYEAREEFFNRNGSVQGGMLAAMLDSVTGLALAGRAPQGAFAVTTRLDTRFLKPATAGTIFGRARVVAGDDRTFRVEGELTNEAGVTIATATAELKIRSAPGSSKA